MARPTDPTLVAEPRPAWRRSAGRVSLSEVHRSIIVPTTASFWRKMIAFSGPGFLIAVGYMDPGNWATDLAGGAKFGYALLSIVMISNSWRSSSSICASSSEWRPDAISRRLVATIIQPQRFGFCGSFVNWQLRRAI